jgi:hypothetical protein
MLKANLPCRVELVNAFLFPFIELIAKALQHSSTSPSLLLQFQRRLEFGCRILCLAHVCINLTICAEHLGGPGRRQDKISGVFLSLFRVFCIFVCRWLSVLKAKTEQDGIIHGKAHTDQLSGKGADIMPLLPVNQVFRSFPFYFQTIIQGVSLHGNPHEIL